MRRSLVCTLCGRCDANALITRVGNTRCTHPAHAPFLLTPRWCSSSSSNRSSSFSPSSHVVPSSCSGNTEQGPGGEGVISNSRAAGHCDAHAHTRTGRADEHDGKQEHWRAGIAVGPDTCRDDVERPTTAAAAADTITHDNSVGADRDGRGCSNTLHDDATQVHCSDKDATSDSSSSSGTTTTTDMTSDAAEPTIVRWVHECASVPNPGVDAPLRNDKGEYVVSRTSWPTGAAAYLTPPPVDDKLAPRFGYTVVQVKKHVSWWKYNQKYPRISLAYINIQVLFLLGIAWLVAFLATEYRLTTEAMNTPGAMVGEQRGRGPATSKTQKIKFTPDEINALVNKAQNNWFDGAAEANYIGSKEYKMKKIQRPKEFSMDDAQQRQQILSRTLTATQSNLFHTSLDDWRCIDRDTLAGYECSISPSVSLTELTPLHPMHFCLSRMSIHRGPVTQLCLDAIVNAANEACLGGGGVDGAIHRAAGALLRRECAAFPGCPTGECILTKGYNLPARFVLHTVGPVGEQPALLRSCYRAVLALAVQNRLRSVGLCAVSTGVYGYPLRAATRIAVEEVARALVAHPDSFDMICFACFKDAEVEAVLGEVTEQRIDNWTPVDGVV